MNINQNYVNKAIKDLGFTKFTEVQNLVIPKVLNGSDIIGCSQTGTGKTHAFLLPIFENLDTSLRDVQVVIAAPTRELAEQIYNNAVFIAERSNREKEIERLKKTQPMIVIGTPGKIKDLAVDENVLNVYKAKIFVIDEADMALEIGFLEDIDLIAGLMSEDLQMLVFSATIPEKIRPFLRKYMNNPEEIFIKPKELSSLNIEHIFIPVKSKDNKTNLLDLLKSINPYIGIIFCNRKEVVDEVVSFLYSSGYKVAKLHGGISPRERKQIMKRINNAEFQYVVASDIASRGIDIDGVSHIINYELPKEMEFYIHRTGRTGRASYTGLAISFYSPNDGAYLDFLEKKGIKILYKDIKNDSLVDRRIRDERMKRKAAFVPVDGDKLNVKRSKKIKPGYKKKYNAKLQRAKKRDHRQKQR